MDPITGGLLATGIGGALSFLGGQGTNETNADIAKRATLFNADEAARNREFQASSAKQQMEFQERMSSTAHQREAEDLRKAGINPILTAGAGASSPSGASASGAQAQAVTAQMQNPLSFAQGLFSSAVSSMAQLKNLDQIDAQTQLIKAQTGKTNIDTEVGKRNLPEAEIKNGLWQWLKNAFKSSAKEKSKSVNPPRIGRQLY